MAETKTVSYESIMRELQEGKYRPVYYLHGEESYYIDKISDYIAEHALAPEERDFNQTVFFGSDVNASQVADAGRTTGGHREGSPEYQADRRLGEVHETAAGQHCAGDVS